MQGADRHGPTAVIKSAAKMDHARTGGTLLNQKFTPQLLARRRGAGQAGAADPHATSGWTATTSSSTWWTPRRCARRRRTPSEHRDLIVRVAGYSDYFCDLSKALQDEIIARTEHQSF